MDIKEIDASLKPCPLCGGRARVVGVVVTRDSFKAEIRCMYCGLTLEHETVETIGANWIARMTPWDLWNRRVEDAEVH